MAESLLTTLEPLFPSRRAPSPWVPGAITANSLRPIRAPSGRTAADLFYERY